MIKLQYRAIWAMIVNKTAAVVVIAYIILSIMCRYGQYISRIDQKSKINTRVYVLIVDFRVVAVFVYNILHTKSLYNSYNTIF